MIRTLNGEPRMKKNEDAVLVRFSRFRQDLQRTSDVRVVQTMRDKAEALRTLVRRQGACYELLFDLAKFKLDAERRVGELLLARDMAGGEKNLKRGQEPPSGSDTPLLSELGVSKYDSRRWQHEARVPEKAYEKWLANCREDRLEPTSQGLFRHAREASTGSKPIRVKKSKPTLADTIRVALEDNLCEQATVTGCPLCARLKEILGE